MVSSNIREMDYKTIFVAFLKRNAVENWIYLVTCKKQCDGGIDLRDVIFKKGQTAA